VTHTILFDHCIAWLGDIGGVVVLVHLVAVQKALALLVVGMAIKMDWRPGSGAGSAPLMAFGMPVGDV